MRLLLFMICLIGLMTSANAQSIFGFGAKPATPAQQQPVTVPSSPNKVMSPDQFRSRVNTLGQESKTPATNQINQILNAKQPPPPAPESAQTNTTQSTTTTSAPTPSIPPVGAGSPTAPTAQPNVAPAPVSPQAPGGTTLPAPQAPVGSKPAAAPQPQPYTGFGVPANQNQGGSTNTDKSNTGWNIKY